MPLTHITDFARLNKMPLAKFDQFIKLAPSPEIRSELNNLRLELKNFRGEKDPSSQRLLHSTMLQRITRILDLEESLKKSQEKSSKERNTRVKRGPLFFRTL